MAYVEGSNLRAVVHREGLPSPQQAADWLRAVAEAVGCAHQRGIIHRDLKPENVLIDRQGRPRVTDFGLAYRPEAETPSARLTRLGELLGTPAYMSPEQATNVHELGPATDIYSLGGILYFLLTGQPPFQGRSMSEVIVQVMTGTAKPPRELNPQAPADLEAICLRCLEKDPALRYPSAEALVAALLAAGRPDTLEEPANRERQPVGASTSVTQLVSEPSAVPPPPSPAPAGPAPDAGRKAARWRRVGLAAAVLGVVAVGVWLLTWLWPDNTKTEALAPPDKLRTEFPLAATMLDDRDNELRPGADGLVRLRADEAVKFRIKVGQAAYVGVWSVNSDGTIVQLFPNEDERDHKFAKDEERVVPRTNAFATETKGSAKFEWVLVRASTRPLEVDNGRRGGDAPFLIFKAEAERRLWAQQRGLERRPEVALAEAVLKYRVGPR
jgi:hypothetical protein